MATSKDVSITIHIDRELKETAESLFDKLGLNMSVAFNMFLRKAINEDAIPFPITGFVHNLSPDAITTAFSNAIDSEIETNLNKGNPIARYDVTAKRAYLELSDGTREYL